MKSFFLLSRTMICARWRNVDKHPHSCNPAPCTNLSERFETRRHTNKLQLNKTKFRAERPARTQYCNTKRTNLCRSNLSHRVHQTGQTFHFAQKLFSAECLTVWMARLGQTYSAWRGLLLTEDPPNTVSIYFLCSTIYMYTCIYLVWYLYPIGACLFGIHFHFLSCSLCSRVRCDILQTHANISDVPPFAPWGSSANELYTNSVTPSTGFGGT